MAVKASKSSGVQRIVPTTVVAMSFANSAPKLDRNEYPLELKKILGILEKRETHPCHERLYSGRLIQHYKF